MDSKQPVGLHHLHVLSLEPRKLLPAGKIVYDLGDCGGVHQYCAELVTKPERHFEGTGEVKEQDPDWGASFDQVGVGSVKHADQNAVHTYSRPKVFGHF